MTELKEKTCDVILTSEEYEGIIERINILNNELAKSSELNDKGDIKELIYKREIDNLVARCKEYKKKIQKKEELDLANEEINKMMIKNKQKTDQKLSSRNNSIHHKKSKEQLEAEIMNEIGGYFGSYKDDI
jgi:hypothetical protein